MHWLDIVTRIKVISFKPCLLRNLSELNSVKRYSKISDDYSQCVKTVYLRSSSPHSSNGSLKSSIRKSKLSPTTSTKSKSSRSSRSSKLREMKKSVEMSKQWS